MGKLTGWIRLGVVLSAVWIALATSVYVNEIVNHPSLVARYIPSLHGQFFWTDDPETTAKAHAEAKGRGKDFSERYVFQKPTFSPAGYLRVAFLPVAIGWIVATMVVLVVRWIIEGFRT